MAKLRHMEYLQDQDRRASMPNYKLLTRKVNIIMTVGISIWMLFFLVITCLTQGCVTARITHLSQPAQAVTILLNDPPSRCSQNGDMIFRHSIWGYTDTVNQVREYAATWRASHVRLDREDKDFVYASFYRCNAKGDPYEG